MRLRETKKTAKSKFIEKRVDVETTRCTKQLNIRQTVMSCHAANVHASLTTHFQVTVPPFRMQKVQKKERKQPC